MIRPARRLAAAVALGLALAAGPARADSPKLEQARQAVEAVRYDEAQRLLVEAVNDGGNSPAALRRIYELSGATAIVLGQRELAEQYYRRWLALDPQAALGDDVAPKLREPFVAAQAYMAAHGRLAVTLARRATGELEVVIASDPLAMAAAVALDGGAPVPLSAERRATLAAPADRAAGHAIVLDEHGNHLVELPIDAAPAPAPPGAPRPGLAYAPPTPRPFFRRWTTWAAPAGALVIAGGVFGTLAITGQQSQADKIDHSGDHFFDEVDGTANKVRRNAAIGLSLITTGAIVAIPAAVFYVRSRRPNDLSRLVLVPVPLIDATGGGLAVTGAF